MSGHMRLAPHVPSQAPPRPAPLDDLRLAGGLLPDRVARRWRFSHPTTLDADLPRSTGEIERRLADPPGRPKTPAVTTRAVAAAARRNVRRCVGCRGRRDAQTPRRAQTRCLCSGALAAAYGSCTQLKYLRPVVPGESCRSARRGCSARRRAAYWTTASSAILARLKIPAGVEK